MAGKKIAKSKGKGKAKPIMSRSEIMDGGLSSVGGSANRLEKPDSKKSGKYNGDDVGIGIYPKGI